MFDAFWLDTNEISCLRSHFRRQGLDEGVAIEVPLPSPGPKKVDRLHYFQTCLSSWRAGATPDWVAPRVRQRGKTRVVIKAHSSHAASESSLNAWKDLQKSNGP
jgi:hypothetical protein